ncbi:MAG: DUF2961 domain-containing protein [Sedimentisphaerales bacterium]|nr:DUF2961 domain-containing protein [Sedimentisphaerales bacterium]
MTNQKRIFAALLTIVFVASGSMCGAAFGAKTVTLESLLEEMVSRETIARLGDPAYTCRQFSSYDRNSTEPGSPTWWANWDRSYFVRVEENDGRKEHVMMDAEGPGAIVRIWATWHGPGGGQFSNGTLRFYLDGKAKPVIEGPCEDLISKAVLAGAPLSESVSPETEYKHRGHNLYLPIPYAKGCKVTYETDVLMDEGARKGEALYYQINYRTYKGGTKVESFTMDGLRAAKATLGRVEKMLQDNDRSGAADLDRNTLEATLGPNGSKSISIKGPRAIRSLEFKLEADDLAQALRSTILKATFDGEQTIWCPIGDFFGTGYHIRPHATWYTAVSKDNTLACYWVMPFRKEAKIEILNVGSQNVKLTKGLIGTGPWKWDKRSCYFHAGWRQWPEIRTQSNKAAKDLGAFDLTWVKVQGKGTYVGDVLTLFNTANAWWGEGDEKIYVDGEAFPSHIGTGSEDYYGYAWCKPAFFESAFHAQPSGEGNFTPGFTVNSRFRALDAIPFTKSIRFDMELWHWAATTMSYSPTTFWYARGGAECDIKPDPREANRAIPKSVDDIIKPRRVDGALEGEKLTVAERTGGVTEVQNIATFNWSGNAQLWWRDGKADDTMTVKFDVGEGGDYDVTLGITKAVDYGIFRISINDETIVESADMFNPSVVAEDMKVGRCKLVAGKNKLKVTILGANAAAVKKHMFGLDYILAVKAK